MAEKCDHIKPVSMPIKDDSEDPQFYKNNDFKKNSLYLVKKPK